MSRVVVTGVGIVTAVGRGVEATVRALREHRTGLGPLELFDSPRNGRYPVGQVPDVAPSGSQGRAVVLGRLALEEALAMSGRDGRSGRVALCVGCTVGGMPETEAQVERLLAGQGIDPSVLRRHEVGHTTAELARGAGLSGPRLTVSTACASGAQAIADGVELLRAGLCDAVVAGGVDALCRLTLNGFASLLLVDEVGCRPFHPERSGMCLGEGAAFLVLERAEEAQARGARALASLAGWANTCDAHHPTAPDPSGRGAEAVVRAALAAAELEAEEVDHVSAHGTGTRDNDRVEGQVLARVFADRPPAIASTKGLFGHTLGAAGAVEAAVSVLAIDRGFTPGNGGAAPDPECGIAPQPAPSDARPAVVLSTSFGFGGNNAALVFCGPERPGPTGVTGPAAALTVSGYALAGAKVPLPEGRAVPLPPAGLHKRRARVPTLAADLAKAAAGDGGLPESAGVFLGSALGSLTETAAFVENLVREREASPMPRAFSASVHNAAAGQVARVLGARGENQTFVHGELSFALALFAAGRRRARGEQAPAVLGAVDELSDYVQRAAEGCPSRRTFAEGGAVLVADDGRPPLATVRLVALARGDAVHDWGQAQGAEAFWRGGAGLALRAGQDHTQWTGDHPSRCAAAVALAVGLVAGELDPTAFGLASRPRSVDVEARAFDDDLALIRIERP